MAFIAIPLVVAAVVIAFLILYLSRKRRTRQGRHGALSGRSVYSAGEQVPLATMQDGVHYRPQQPSHPPSHRIGRLGAQKTAPGVNGIGIHIGTPKGNSICPYCQNPINPEEITVCPQCKTAHHQKCWQLLNGCSVFGCSRAPMKSM